MPIQRCRIRSLNGINIIWCRIHTRNAVVIDNNDRMELSPEFMDSIFEATVKGSRIEQELLLFAALCVYHVFWWLWLIHMCHSVDVTMFTVYCYNGQYSHCIREHLNVCLWTINWCITSQKIYPPKWHFAVIEFIFIHKR